MIKKEKFWPGLHRVPQEMQALPWHRGDPETHEKKEILPVGRFTCSPYLSRKTNRGTYLRTGYTGSVTVLA